MFHPFYEIICTHSGEVGAVFQNGKTRVLVDHALPERGVDDLALSIIAHHFQVAAKRAKSAITWMPANTDEELVAKFFPLFRDKFIANLVIPQDGSVIISHDEIGTWCHEMLKRGKVGPYGAR